MKELENVYHRRVESHPELSSFVCFCRAVRDVQPNRRALLQGFKKLVDINDYSATEKKDVMVWLEKYAK